VIINNQKLYVNREDGFAGFSLKKDEFVSECSELDEIIVFRGDGTMMVTKVDEKKYVGKDVRHIAVFRKTEPEPVYNMIYQDGRGGNAMVKRFTVGGTTRDKEYTLTRGKEGSKILWFAVDDPEKSGTVKVILKPKPKLRNTQFDVNFHEIEVKGRGTNGNIISRNPVHKVIPVADGKPATKPVQIALPVVKETSSKIAVQNKGAIKTKQAERKPAAKKVKPLQEEKPVTVEWDFAKKKGKITSDRARILSELEKKSVAKKAQTKLDL
jgi:hypothetical protein